MQIDHSNMLVTREIRDTIFAEYYRYSRCREREGERARITYSRKITRKDTGLENLGKRNLIVELYFRKVTSNNL